MPPSANLNNLSGTPNSGDAPLWDGDEWRPGPVVGSLQAALNALSSTQGAVLYRDASAWVALPPGVASQVLQSGGPAANPAWATPTAGMSILGSALRTTTLATSGTITSITFAVTVPATPVLLVAYMPLQLPASTSTIWRLKVDAVTVAQHEANTGAAQVHSTLVMVRPITLTPGSRTIAFELESGSGAVSFYLDANTNSSLTVLG